ncbi:MAG: HAAS signaling domain-containing protein, partial [Actinomycetota bacterium]
MTEGVRRYLQAVEAELSDLGAEDRSELLADVEEHLTDVAAEHEGSLEERLGDPSSYANELRSSAGFPPRTSSESAGSDPAWRSILKRVATDKRFRSARVLFTEVEPGWWVLRGYLLVALMGDLSRSDFPFPRINGNQFLGLVGIAFVVWASLWLGRLGRRSGVGAVTSAVASALVAIAAIATVADARSPSTVYEAQGPAPGGVRHWDGSEALNLCPYTSDGKLLSGVQVFDQAGRPITEVPRLPGAPVDGALN